MSVFELSPGETAQVAINGFGAMQKLAEFSALLHVVSELEPKIILEIGVGRGGTSWAWSKLSGLKHLIAVDMPGGPWGGGPTEESMGYIKSNSRARVTYIQGSSANSECLNAVNKHLDGEKIDFLFIDGDHSYAGVKTDFLTYRPLVKEGGLIAFHDICKHDPSSGCEVEKFWLELKESCPKERYSEFIQEPTNWGGIGVVRV